MRCPSCGTRDLPVTLGAYRCCGIVTRLSDPGYIPAPGYTPSPYREAVDRSTPAVESLREVEKGWEQGGSPELVLDEEETPAQKAQAARRARETAEERSAASRKGALTKAIAREARHAARESTRAIEAATRQRARQGARTGAWYADRRAS